jgi:lysyl-tRNA synthetase class 2
MVRERSHALWAIREFFRERSYLEVETPSLGRTAPPDPYIEPLRVHVGASGPYYLHTSPEIEMKKLLGRGYDRIFQICKVFRVEEFEEHHAIEFTMLEWYMKGGYGQAMEETEMLVRSLARSVGSPVAEAPWSTYRLADLFLDAVGFDPLPLDRESLLVAMGSRGFEVPAGDETWVGLFFRLYVQEVEPRLHREEGPCLVWDWPASITAMAKKKDDHTVERFELYMGGLEIANGYAELLDPAEQRLRLSKDNEVRVRQGKPVFPPDESFLEALARIDGPVAGVAVGVDRLLMALAGKDRIDEVVAGRFRLAEPGKD